MLQVVAAVEVSCGGGRRSSPAAPREGVQAIHSQSAKKIPASWGVTTIRRRGEGRGARGKKYFKHSKRSVGKELSSGDGP